MKNKFEVNGFNHFIKVELAEIRREETAAEIVANVTETLEEANIETVEAVGVVTSPTTAIDETENEIEIKNEIERETETKSCTKAKTKTEKKTAVATRNMKKKIVQCF
jgi:hypothetical protein